MRQCIFRSWLFAMSSWGQKDKSRSALNQALTAPMTVLLDGTPGETEEIRGIFKQICELIRIRLDDANYLKNPEYGNILIACIRSMKNNSPMGFVQFHAGWLEEWYVANRQYHKAHEVLRTFS